MGPCFGNVHHVNGLNEYEAEVFEKVVVLLEVGQWEAGREEHVDKDDVESSNAKDSIVHESAQFIRVDSLVKS